MANLLLSAPPTVEEQIRQMREDACYDIANDEEFYGQCAAVSPGLWDIRAPQSPPKVPKIFLSNNCRFNCAYCGCRAGNGEKSCYCHEPRYMAEVAVAEALRSGHGIFLTSSIYRSADYTEELIVESLRCMREEFHYGGYIHAKIMPGADPKLIEKAGRYADRLSVNIEVAKSEGYSRIAKQKNRTNILTPMRQISDLIREAGKEKGRRFARSQTTQLMAGSTGEHDRTILTLSGALYQKYALKRVYYTAFQYRYPAAGYDLPLVSTPKWRPSRLYQADRLMQLYGFTADEIAPEEEPDLPFDVDPKTAWALRHLKLFPVEVNTADYETLIRVPGIGITYAKRILEARKTGAVTHDVLRKIGVSLKRSIYFITCSGRYMGGGELDAPDRLRRRLAADNRIKGGEGEQLHFEQMLAGAGG